MGRRGRKKKSEKRCDHNRHPWRVHEYGGGEMTCDTRNRGLVVERAVILGAVCTVCDATVVDGRIVYPELEGK